MFNKNHILVRRMMMGYTQTELGDLIGRHHTTISKYELGVYVPDPPTLARLCKVLKTEPNKVITGWDDET